ncbi:hypothetical protein Bca101_016911 [Brassica carinata]
MCLLFFFLKGHKIINYDQKDGFCDVYGITSKSVSQGKMTCVWFLRCVWDLQAISVSDNVDYEVILVNQLIDPELPELKKRTSISLLECQESILCSWSGVTDLTKKIADIVVEHMGGPVEDADEVLKRWMHQSYELRNSFTSHGFAFQVAIT